MTLADNLSHIVRLHLDNDEGIYNECHRRVAEAIEQAEANPYTAEVLGDAEALHVAERWAVADTLKDFVEALARNADPDDPVDSGSVTLLASDLITHALGVIDWDDMATDYIAEVKGEDE